MVVYHHLLSLLDHTALDHPAWAEILLAIPHNRVEVTSHCWPLTITTHDLQPVALFHYNSYRKPQKIRIRQLHLTDLQVDPLFTIRQNPLGTTDWTPIFVRGFKTTLIQPETSVTKKIIRDLSLGYEPFCYDVTCLIFFLHRFEIYLIFQARHLPFDNTFSLPATFSYAIMTISLLSIEPLLLWPCLYG